MSEQSVETLEEFRLRARRWIRTNLNPEVSIGDEDAEAHRARDAELQAKIYDAGFAGFAVPVQYGGCGLTLDHQRLWTEETAGYGTPRSYVVSIGMIMPTILEFGSEDLKTRHVPAILRGEESWIQLLSEPGGGSDLAGARTRATPDGRGYRIDGSKMWSSGANFADYGLCLARVDWDAPKHRGLSMFAVDLKNPGVTITPITPVTGGHARFFAEYLDNVWVKSDYLVGRLGDGWTVAQRLLFHERNATSGAGYGYGLGGGHAGVRYRSDITSLAVHHSAIFDPAVVAAIADDYVETAVGAQLAERINIGMRAGKLVGHWGSLLKLGIGLDTPLNAERALAISGAEGVIWTQDEPAGDPSGQWLRVRGCSISGGTNEIQCNIISERLLNLPREPGDDPGTPFNKLRSTSS